MRLSGLSLLSSVVAIALAGGCAGGTRARGSVQTGLPRHDDFFHRVRALLATVESAEETLEAPVLVDPPPGMTVRVTGEGPAALAVIDGAPDEGTHLSALLTAERLAAAPPLLDAVGPKVEALLAESPALLKEAMLMPGPKGNHLRAAHLEASNLLKALPQRAQAASSAARELLRKLGG